MTSVAPAKQSKSPWDRDHDAPKVVEDWPEPLPLQDELQPVQQFEEGLLPRRLRSWVMDIAERMNCPPDLVAIPAMVAAGSLVGRRLGIRPQRHTSWTEAGNLWGCTVSRPGSLKSPAAHEALSPLRHLEANAAEEHSYALRQYKAEETLHKLEREAAEKAARAAMKGKGGAGYSSAMSRLLAVEEPETPAERRFLTSDVTAEKLGEICAANPQGVLVHRDELLSLLVELDHPEKSSARGFFLTGWSGLGGYTFDRITRGTIRVPAVNLSILGTTQPGRIASYIRESIKRYDDGMVQRLQLLTWPDVAPEFREADRHPNTSWRTEAHECFWQIASIEPHRIGADIDETEGRDAFPFLRLCGEAQEIFSEWRGELERKVRSDELAPSLIAHLAKYRGLVPRLALLCHLASDGEGPVSADALIRAIHWSEYLESHARRAYASTIVDDAEVARTIWRRIKRGDLPKQFTARDIQRKGWSGLRDVKRISSGLGALADADWLAATDLETGGRPSTVFEANPKALMR